MVFGTDLIDNIKALVPIVNHIEIVLFHTPAINNIPNAADMEQITELKHIHGLTFTVHLPAFLQIASTDKSIREESVQMACNICRRMTVCQPAYFILHIPYLEPTLVPEPGVYFKPGSAACGSLWIERALKGLSQIQTSLHGDTKLLVENINYSPELLMPFLEKENCQLCLDIGHLLLGQEDVAATMQQYYEKIHEIHLHGVQGYEEHLSLTVLPTERIHKWLDFLKQQAYTGILTLEVFSPEDLLQSMEVIWAAMSAN